MSRDILVLSRKNLFSKKVEFQGFIDLEANQDFFDIIMKNFEYKERNDDLEKDSSYKQIIPYVWLINPKTKKVFLYQRSKTGNEKRLYNKYSGGVGGHIDKDTEEKSSNPINDAMMRELREEVSMENYPSPKVVGFINDETGDVEKVHFGIVAIGETIEDVRPAEDMASGLFYSIFDADKILTDPNNNVENWTKISWPFVKEYLLSK